MVYILKKWTTASVQVVYYMPDYLNLVNEFIWQTKDRQPDYPRIGRFLDHWDKNIDEIWSRKNQELHRTCARNIVTLMRRSHRILHTKQDSMMFYLRKMLGWKRDENVKNTSKRNVFTGVIQIMRKRNQQLRKQYNRKGLIDFYYTPTT